MKNIVIIGCGDSAPLAIEIIQEQQQFNIVGFIDCKEPIGKVIFDYKIIGRDEDIGELTQKHCIDGAIIAIGDSWTRYKVASRLKELSPELTFFNLIHSSCIISKDAVLGEGILALPGCIIESGCKIGDHCYLGLRATLGHNGNFGDFVTILGGSLTGGYTDIGDLSTLTLHVTAFDRVKIGRNTVVGASSLVTRSLPDNVLAYGSPAKIIRTREDRDQILRKKGK